MTDEVTTLRAMYECFNARDIEGVFRKLDNDVEWANGMDGGHVQGKHAVREYWTRQWSEVSPVVEPLSFESIEDGYVAVEVRQVINDLSGHPLAALGGLHTQTVSHHYRFKDGKVLRFDIGHRA